MRVPVVVIVGVDPDVMASAMVGLQFDLPRAAAVRHHIDVERQVLTRTVSDLSGVLEHEEIELAHACVSCAIREGVLPTPGRLARGGQHSCLVVHLPVGAEAFNLCGALAWDTRLARLLTISSVITAASAAAGPVSKYSPMTRSPRAKLAPLVSVAVTRAHGAKYAGTGPVLRPSQFADRRVNAALALVEKIGAPPRSTAPRGC